MAKTGGATGSISYSPGRLLRIKQERAAQDARWKALNGPVHVRRMTPEELEQYKIQRVSSRS
jgi:hypothetical protein